MDLVNNYGYLITKDEYGNYSSTYERPKSGGNKYIVIELKNKEKTQYYFVKASANYDIANYRVYKEHYSNELQVCYYSYSNMKYGIDKINIFGEWKGVYLYSKTEVKKFIQSNNLIENQDYWFVNNRIIDNVFSVFTSTHGQLSIKSTDVIEYFGNGRILILGYDRHTPDKTIHYLDDELFHQRVDKDTILVKTYGNVYSKNVYVDKQGNEYINGGRLSRSNRLYLKENQKL